MRPAESSRAGSCPSEAVGVAPDLDARARAVASDGVLEAFPARATAGAAPNASGAAALSGAEASSKRA